MEIYYFEKILIFFSSSIEITKIIYNYEIIFNDLKNYDFSENLVYNSITIFDGIFKSNARHKFADIIVYDLKINNLIKNHDINIFDKLFELRTEFDSVTIPITYFNYKIILKETLKTFEEFLVQLKKLI
uniref:Uncharacterized protein n=1 Tax=viral metagenome TaxID=1070528 RepID=A0A6C0ADV2_9ZZZZ